MASCPTKPSLSPKKERGERLMCLPSIRKERVETLRRMCELFADGWTTYRIANATQQRR